MIRLNHDFSPKDTFECGQCFRWNNYGTGYIGIAFGKIARVEKNTVFCPEEDNEFWSGYFSVSTDYDEIKKILTGSDTELKKCIEFGKGIRILKQDVWETIISFIISANNNIPRIKKIIETMCRSFGDRLKIPEGLGIPDGEYYSFPSPGRILKAGLSALAPLRAGYRDKYIFHAAETVCGGQTDLTRLPSLSTQDAKKELMKIKGVGGKVADCILLFSLGRYETFPKDVWIKRVLNTVYGVSEKETDGFIAEKYGGYAGFAQQYLYYYYRENNL